MLDDDDDDDGEDPKSVSSTTRSLRALIEKEAEEPLARGTGPVGLFHKLVMMKINCKPN